MRESGTHAQMHTFCDGARAQAHTSVPVRVHRRTVRAGARAQAHTLCPGARAQAYMFVQALVRKRTRSVPAAQFPAEQVGTLSTFFSSHCRISWPPMTS